MPLRWGVRCSSSGPLVRVVLLARVSELSYLAHMSGWDWEATVGRIVLALLDGGASLQEMCGLVELVGLCVGACGCRMTPRSVEPQAMEHAPVCLVCVCISSLFFHLLCHCCTRCP